MLRILSLGLFALLSSAGGFGLVAYPLKNGTMCLRAACDPSTCLGAALGVLDQMSPGWGRLPDDSQDGQVVMLDGRQFNAQSGNCLASFWQNWCNRSSATVAELWDPFQNLYNKCKRQSALTTSDWGGSWGYQMDHKISPDNDGIRCPPD
ncbi:MAG: hypothetical protein M1838_004769 [Thelocarpon superellum]|nr:MAG: hypothetical protein M1838_004769 [Thelocarpon superellum]